MVRFICFVALIVTSRGSKASPPSNMSSAFRVEDNRVAVTFSRTEGSLENDWHQPQGLCANQTFQPSTPVEIISQIACGECDGKKARFCSEDRASFFEVSYSPLSLNCSVPIGDCDECLKVDSGALNADGCSLSDKTICLPVEIPVADLAKGTRQHPLCKDITFPGRRGGPGGPSYYQLTASWVGVFEDPDDPDEPSGCADFEGWLDQEGESCSDFDSQHYCTPDGKTGSGWDNSWGTLKDWYDDSGNTVVDACCACGGGHKPLLVG